MNDTYKKGAELAKKGDITGLNALIETTKQTDPTTAYLLQSLLSSAFNNMLSGKR